MKKTGISVLLAALLLCAVSCQNGGAGSETTASGESETASAVTTPDYAGDASDMFTDRDRNTAYDESGAVQITLNGSGASATSDAVRIDGGRVTVTEEAIYVIAGTLENGQIIVDAPETAKPHLIFSGASVTSATSAALYIKECDKVVITLANGTENALSNGGNFAMIDESNIDAALFSKQDLSLNGGGSLAVTSPGGHGIVCKDDLVFAGGVYTVTALSHAIDANDSVRIAESELTLTAGKDGIHAENSDDTALGFVYIASGTVTAVAEGDGISAGAYLQIEDGAFDLRTGGGSENGTHTGGMGGFPGMGGFGSSGSVASSETDSTSTKGLKATTGVLLSGGTYAIDAADDAVHANGSITVSGGTFTIQTGDDGFHADETLTVNGGAIEITESYEGLEALHIVIAGGNICLSARDDGLNAAGGVDSSGTVGNRGDKFGGGRPGGMGGGMGSGSSKGSILISGGDLYIKASGDGVDANGTIEITGGNTVVCGPTQGDTATLDYDTSAVIRSGTFIGTGASGMAQTFSDSEQGVIAVRLNQASAGTEIVLSRSDGTVLLTYSPELSFSVVILSSPELITGEKYTITVGETSGTFAAQ